MKKINGQNLLNIVLICALLISLIFSMGKTYQRDKEIAELKNVIVEQQSIIVEYQYE